jgi:hypothetical protein
LHDFVRFQWYTGLRWQPQSSDTARWQVTGHTKKNDSHSPCTRAIASPASTSLR